MATIPRWWVYSWFGHITSLPVHENHRLWLQTCHHETNNVNLPPPAAPAGTGSTSTPVFSRSGWVSSHFMCMYLYVYVWVGLCRHCHPTGWVTSCCSCCKNHNHQFIITTCDSMGKLIASRDGLALCERHPVSKCTRIIPDLDSCLQICRVLLAFKLRDDLPNLLFACIVPIPEWNGLTC